MGPILRYFISATEGNMVYYNDCPRLVEIMLNRLEWQHHESKNNSEVPLHHCACSTHVLTGGANLASLWTEGNGMQSRFGRTNDNTDWNYSRNINSTSTNAEAPDDDIGAATVQLLLDNPPPSLVTGVDGCWNFVLLQDDEHHVTPVQGQSISAEALLYERATYPQSKELPPVLSVTSHQRYCCCKPLPMKAPDFEKPLDLVGWSTSQTAVVRGYEVYANIIRDEFGFWTAASFQWPRQCSS